MRIAFYLNRELVRTEVDPHQTTLTFLRESKGLTGVKETCNEGDCGACVVAIGELVDGRMRYHAVNSCLYPVSRLHGAHVVTLEGIRDDESLHPIQTAIEQEHGSQCGFCTSGIILSLFCLFVKKTTPDRSEILQALDGSLCRCTGYASILKAAEHLSEQLKSETILVGSLTPEYFDGLDAKLEDILNEEQEKETLAIPLRDYFVPEDLHELFGILEAFDNPAKLTLINGDTDVMVAVNVGKLQPKKIIDLHRIREFTRIAVADEVLSIGAAATLTEILESDAVNNSFPALIEAVEQMCSTPIRNVATLVGNVCTASPIADAIPPLLAYDATVVAQSIKGTRRASLHDWFTAYRKTALGHDEIVVAIELPLLIRHASFEKTGKRKTLDIATVNSALSFRLETGYFEDVRLFYGGVAAIPFEAEMTAAFLEGKQATEAVVFEASLIISKEISPLSDVRGSREFRKELAGNHLLKHFSKLLPSIFDS